LELMRTPRSPRFTLRDALVLIMATAVGFAATRSLAKVRYVSTLVSGEMSEGTRFGWVAAAYSPADSPRPQALSHASYWCQRIAFWPCPCLATSTIVALTLAFLRCDPPRKRLLRQPGILAGLAWIASFLVVAVASPPTVFQWSSPVPPFYWYGWWIQTWFALPKVAGFAVANSWLSLALSGRWAAVRGLPDRLGRLVGSWWIGLGVLRLLASWAWLVT
jgi:hypothetical protein